MLHYLFIFTFIFILLDSKKLAVANNLPPSEQINKSSFSACQNHDFKWISQKTRRQWNKNQKLTQAIQRDFQCNKTSDLQVLFGPITYELDKKEKQDIFKSTQETASNIANANRKKTLDFIECFQSKIQAKEKNVSCIENIKKEQNELKTKIFELRALAALSEPNALETTENNAYKKDYSFIQLPKNKSGWPPYSQDEFNKANEIINSNEEFKNLKKQLNDSGYQAQPQSMKNFKYHYGAPLKIKELGQFYELEYQNIISNTPVLKYLLETSDPTQNYQLTSEKLYQAYSKLEKDQENAEKILNSAKLDNCTLIHLNTFDTVLAQHINKENPPNLGLCRMAEEWLDDCNSKESYKSALEGISLLTTCVFASPAVCSTLGIISTSTDLKNQKTKLSQLNANHSAGNISYASVEKQNDEFNTTAALAPLAVLPVGGLVSSTAKKTISVAATTVSQNLTNISKAAAALKFPNLPRLTKSISRWSQLAPGSTEGILKVLNRAQELSKNHLNKKPITSLDVENDIDLSIRETINRNPQYKSMAASDQEKEILKIKSCLGLKGNKNAH